MMSINDRFDLYTMGDEAFHHAALNIAKAVFGDSRHDRSFLRQMTQQLRRFYASFRKEAGYATCDIILPKWSKMEMYASDAHLESNGWNLRIEFDFHRYSKEFQRKEAYHDFRDTAFNQSEMAITTNASMDADDPDVLGTLQGFFNKVRELIDLAVKRADKTIAIGYRLLSPMVAYRENIVNGKPMLNVIFPTQSCFEFQNTPRTSYGLVLKDQLYIERDIDYLLRRVREERWIEDLVVSGERVVLDYLERIGQGKMEYLAQMNSQLKERLILAEES